MPIRHSVGRGGGNNREDVRLIQTALNFVRGRANLPLLKVDGLVGPKTVGAILDFQQGRIRTPDGRIDPFGATLRKLEETISSDVEASLRATLLSLLEGLDHAMQSRNLAVPRKLQAAIDSVKGGVGLLKGGPAPDVRPAVYYPQRGGATFRLAAGPLVAVGAAEAAFLLLFAMIAMLIIIQNAPAMTPPIEELMRRIQVAMATVIDEIKETIENIEDLVKRNFRAGVLCAAALEAFRELSKKVLEFLKKKRPGKGDELGLKRFQEEWKNLATKWQDALKELLACFAAHGIQL